MTTPFLLRIDPDGTHHRELGRLAAKHLFRMCPDGGFTDEHIELVDGKAQGAIRKILEPLGASHEDMVAAVRWTANFFAESVNEMLAALHDKAGHA